MRAPPERRSAPAVAGRGAEKITNLAGLPGHFNQNVRAPSSAPVERLLPRLDGVRRSGAGWRADCPLGHRSKGTLSISEFTDGTVLLKDHAGCGAAEILAALGLTLADLFVERPQDTQHVKTPQERREARERALLWRLKSMLPDIYRESLIVLMAAGKLNHGEHLSPEDDERLMLAVQRIEHAREGLHGH